MTDRRVFICSPTRKLVEHINMMGGGIFRVLEDEVVVLSELVDFEQEIEGWGPSIKRAAKQVFIESNVGDDEPFGNFQELADVLGPGTPAEVFDRWFVLRPVDFLEIEPKAWQKAD